MKTRPWKIVVVAMIVSTAVSACGSKASAVPTVAASPTFTPSATPMITPTIPRPYEGDTSHEYYEQVGKVVQSLSGIDSATPDFLDKVALARSWKVILLPNTAYLYYSQNAILARNDWGDTGAAATLYLAYGYTRGESLYDASGLTAQSQELTLGIHAVAEIDRQAFSIGDLEYSAGVGASDDSELLDWTAGKALLADESGSGWLSGVDPGTILKPPMVTDIQLALKSVVGYAMGIDQNPGLPEPTRLALLASALSSSNWADRYHAAKSLQKLGSAANAALPELIQSLVLHDKGEPDAWNAIFQAILVIQPKVLPDDLPDERIASLQCSAGAPGPESGAVSAVLPALLAGLGDVRWETRGLSAIVVYELLDCTNRDGTDAESVWPILLKLQKDDNAVVRMTALTAMSIFRQHAAEAAPALIAGIQDTDPGVRRAAMQGLARLWRSEDDETTLREGFRALSTALTDTNLEVRLAALQSINELYRGSQEEQALIVPALIQALMDESVEVQDKALITLWAVSGQRINAASPREKAEAFRTWWDQNKP